ncbi:MAG: OprO/OprP family phosphate-selective porin [Bacteroidota bacterium]|nr:OprO/OprP family phosphate-selective porin [Bacteroidota bacterium]
MKKNNCDRKSTTLFQKKFLILLTILLISFTGVKSQDKVDAKFGSGISIVDEDSTFSLRFSARIQSLLIVQTPVLDDVIDFDDGTTNFLIRRSRLKFDGFAYNPKITYKLELGLSNRDLTGGNGFTSNTPRLILDAVVKWNFYENFSLWVGQTKLPGNRERVISSQQLQFVDRSIVNSRFNLDRDAGVQLHHKIKIGQMVFKEIASVSLGEGRGITAPNQGGFDYTGRVEFLPLGEFTKKGDYVGSDIYREETPKISLGFTYDYNDGAVRERGQLGEFTPVQRDLKSIMADVMIKYKGISIMSEFIQRNTPVTPLYFEGDDILGSFYTGRGFSIQGGYLFENDFEVSGRYSTVMPEEITGNPNIDMYTLGFSRYIVGHNLKVQSDISYTQTGQNEGAMFRMQVELAF